jgi:hypothetical protein
MPITAAELDLYWMFHGGIFYFGMRREVYKAKVATDVAAFITHSVDSLLQGYPAAIRGLLNAAPSEILDLHPPSK